MSGNSAHSCASCTRLWSGVAEKGLNGAPAARRGLGPLAPTTDATLTPRTRLEGDGLPKTGSSSKSPRLIPAPTATAMCPPGPLA